MEFEFPSKNTPVTPNSIEKSLAEKDVIGILARAQNFEFCRQIQEGLDCLSPLWKYYTERPLTGAYHPSVQAEILLRCGSLLSYCAAYKYLDHQDLARKWLTESVGLFESSGISDKVAEAETELAMTYWRDARHTEAIKWLESASAKVTNPLNAVNIKNISYQLMVLFSLNTPTSLQAGAAMIKEQDTCVELCEDSRVKVHYYNNSGLLMTRVNLMADALVRHQKCVHFCLEVGNRFSMAIAENNIGFIYNYFKQYDLAAEHTLKGIKVSEELGVFARAAEAYETLAQICLNRQLEKKSSNFSEAWQAINKSLDFLQPIGFRKGFDNTTLQYGDSSTLILSLQTKSKILLHEGKKGEALALFSTIYQMILVNVDQASADCYARDFVSSLEFIHSSSYTEQTTKYERKLIETAIVSSNGNLNKIAANLEISEESLKELFAGRHKDLQKQYKIKIDFSFVGELSKRGERNKNNKVSPNSDSGDSKQVLKKYNCKGFPAYIPESVEAKVLLPILEPRLTTLGLIEGRVAVVGATPGDDRTYPLVIREYINSNYYYGHRIDSMGLIGLESDNPDVYSLCVFEPDMIEIIGNIVGYCEFNFKDKIYEYRPLNLKTIK